MRLSQHQLTLLEKARANRLNAQITYKKAWLAEPTARGFPSVDRALDRLERAETMERLAERGELAYDAFDKAA